jgi:hypothetical protein
MVPPYHPPGAANRPREAAALQGWGSQVALDHAIALVVAGLILWVD